MFSLHAKTGRFLSNRKTWIVVGLASCCTALLFGIWLGPIWTPASYIAGGLLMLSAVLFGLIWVLDWKTNLVEWLITSAARAFVHFFR